MSRRRRGLTPEDEELWQRVAGSVAPLHPRPLRPAEALPAPKLKPKPLPVPAVPAPFRIGEAAPPPAPAPRPPAPLRMDAKAHARLRRGSFAPEARLDLHGMTLAEAHPRLIGFVGGAHARGLRLLLVITGKGRGGGGPIPQHPGLLKAQVPHWLGLPPLAPMILQVMEAHLRHGGAGAYYVYLRRAG